MDKFAQLIGRLVLQILLQSMYGFLKDRTAFIGEGREQAVEALTATVVEQATGLVQKQQGLGFLAVFITAERIKPLVEQAIAWAESGAAQFLVNGLARFFPGVADVAKAAAPGTDPELVQVHGMLLALNAADGQLEVPGPAPSDLRTAEFRPDDAASNG